MFLHHFSQGSRINCTSAIKICCKEGKFYDCKNLLSVPRIYLDRHTFFLTLSVSGYYRCAGTGWVNFRILVFKHYVQGYSQVFEQIFFVRSKRIFASFKLLLRNFTTFNMSFTILDISKNFNLKP